MSSAFTHGLRRCDPCHAILRLSPWFLPCFSRFQVAKADAAKASDKHTRLAADLDAAVQQLAYVAF